MITGRSSKSPRQGNLRCSTASIKSTEQARKAASIRQRMGISNGVTHGGGGRCVGCRVQDTPAGSLPFARTDYSMEGSINRTDPGKAAALEGTRRGYPEHDTRRSGPSAMGTP